MTEEEQEQLNRVEQKVDDLRTQVFGLEELIEKLLSTEFHITLKQSE